MQATVSLFSALVAEPFDWSIVNGKLDVGPVASVLGFFTNTVRLRDTSSNTWFETTCATYLGDSDDDDDSEGIEKHEICGLRGGRQYEVHGTLVAIEDLAPAAVAAMVDTHGSFAMPRVMPSSTFMFR
jgi:hypothetical protein